ncbi:bZIP transcription factor [Oceanobacillus oncorhynchi]|uniref:bZIP transcription factor n=1 Tax=Oceanobacillus oncorhynchi TaxID=545501 RepID=UPI001865E178|nr:bZIP transcription factor [Oceanobacillus oncorhynchi]
MLKKSKKYVQKIEELERIISHLVKENDDMYATVTRLNKENEQMDSKLQVIKTVIANNKSPFYTWEQDGKFYVQTAICNVGGCIADYDSFDSCSDAALSTIIRVLNEEEIKMIGICHECREEAADDTHCLKCGGAKMPVYDEYPNWIKFCPNCDKYAD